MFIDLSSISVERLGDRKEVDKAVQHVALKLERRESFAKSYQPSFDRSIDLAMCAQTPKDF